MASLIWITGLAGSGKTTIGRSVYEKIKQKMPNTVFVDGDAYREILGSGKGYTREARFEVAMQTARLCHFLVRQDINVVCSTISLFKEVHKFNRDNVQNYFEIFIECSMEELIRRDQKQLYSKALRKEISDVVGVDIEYDIPVNCSLKINNSETGGIDEKVNQILNLINK